MFSFLKRCLIILQTENVLIIFKFGIKHVIQSLSFLKRFPKQILQISFSEFYSEELNFNQRNLRRNETLSSKLNLSDLNLHTSHLHLQNLEPAKCQPFPLTTASTEQTSSSTPFVSLLEHSVMQGFLVYSHRVHGTLAFSQ